MMTSPLFTPFSQLSKSVRYIPRSLYATVSLVPNERFPVLSFCLCPINIEMHAPVADSGQVFVSVKSICLDPCVCSTSLQSGQASSCARACDSVVVSDLTSKDFLLHPTQLWIARAQVHDRHRRHFQRGRNQRRSASPLKREIKKESTCSATAVVHF
eukprot:6197234-Pleurochrysis_carterae.AAC.1